RPRPLMAPLDPDRASHRRRPSRGCRSTPKTGVRRCDQRQREDRDVTKPTDHNDQLRAWAKGIYTLAAATELLIRTGLATEERPWLRPFEGDSGGCWIDFE